VSQRRIYLRALGYIEEDGRWVAHCLETDLVGASDSFKEALVVLKEITETQLAYAIEKNDPGLFFKAAPKWIPSAWRSEMRRPFLPPRTRAVHRKQNTFTLPVPGNVAVIANQV